jgi:ABC-2 type transport system permease protein
MTRTIQKYTRTALMAAAGVVGDSPLFVVDYLLRFLRVALLLAIWHTLFQHRNMAAGLSLASVLTYTLIAEAFADLLEGNTSLAESFWDGTILSRFLRPLSLFGQFAAEAGGLWLFNFGLFSLPLLLCAPLLGVNPLPANAAAGALFAVSLALGVLVGLALDYIFGALAIGLVVPPFAIAGARRALGGLLSGAIIPLALMPWGVGKALAWLPFASLASAPLQIYIGKGNPLWLLAGQAFWAVVLWPLARWMWAVNREKMVSYGG